MKRLTVALAFAVLAMTAALGPGETADAQSACFTSTGFCITNPAFRSYFDARGGTSTFGPPISREFTLLGFRVQFFQGHIMQLQPNGSVATMNLLDKGLMPVTRVNGSTFPAEDPRLVADTPRPDEAGYGVRIIDFIRRNAPNEFNGQPVDFFRTFISTVSLEMAYPAGGGNPALVPLLNLEIWGSVTSHPMADPSNPGFIYQRYQRSIMHYREVCRCTERILLADWFKTVITGQGLPADLAADMASSPFIYQWNPNGTRWLNRPDELPNSDLTNAFVPELPGFPTPPATTGSGGGAAPPTATPGPGAGGPSLTLQINDTRVDPGDSITVTLIARDEKGLDWIRWEGHPKDDDDQEDPALDQEHEFDCDDRQECANVWEVEPTIPGRYEITARARTSDGRRGDTTVELRVRDSDGPTPTATVSPTQVPATATPAATLAPTQTPTNTRTGQP